MNSPISPKIGRTLCAAAAALVVVAPLTVPTAGAAPAAATNPAPTWSGLDTREWARPIPAPGAAAETVPLDPSLSLPQAGRAVRQVYDTPNDPSGYSGLDVSDFPWDRTEWADLNWGQPTPDWGVFAYGDMPKNYPL